MSPRSQLVASIALFLLAAPLLAQEQAVPEIADGNFQFLGEVTANNVYVRSGASENYYPTMKLDRGAQVTVVGERFEWLKILPPEGSFSYVAKVHVERRGDGTVGRVTRADLPVRAGSLLNSMKTAVQARLDINTDVKIIGEQDEYFKIAPPPGAYLYIHKQFVRPVRPLNQSAAPADAPAQDLPATPQPAQLQHDAVEQEDVPAQIPAQTEAAAPSTQPAGAAELAFDEAEAKFLAASKQPVTEQPVAEMLAQYEELVKNPTLPASMRRIAEHRIRTLQVRTEVIAELERVRKADEEASRRAQALRAEREEIEQRIRENEIKVFTAVGTLRTSSLQGGRGVLYRLTDPNTGRTLVYLRSDDTALAESLGQFIGVRGEVVTDQQMNIRVITPTAIEVVEIANVPSRVAAQILPPSLLSSGSASAGE